MKELFKRERLRIKLTQAEMGEKLGLDQSQISNIEKGKSIPTTDIFLKMKELWNTNISQFFGEDNQPLVESSELIKLLEKQLTEKEEKIDRLNREIGKLEEKLKFSEKQTVK